MADQNRGGNGSYTAWNRCDCLNDRLSFCVCNVSAEFSFFVYVDSDINNGLACTQAQKVIVKKEKNRLETDELFLKK